MCWTWCRNFHCSNVDYYNFDYYVFRQSPRDVDVAGELLDGGAVFGEVKWSVKHLGLNQISELRERMAQTSYLQTAKQKYLMLFSRSGFSPQLQAAAKSEPGLRLISLERLLG
jgi:uncharacterized protein